MSGSQRSVSGSSRLVEKTAIRAWPWFVLLCATALSGCAAPVPVESEANNATLNLYLENNDDQEAQFRVKIADQPAFVLSVPDTPESPNVRVVENITVSEGLVRVYAEELTRGISAESDFPVVDEAFLVIRLEINSTIAILAFDEEPLFD